MSHTLKPNVTFPFPSNTDGIHLGIMPANIPIFKWEDNVDGFENIPEGWNFVLNDNEYLQIDSNGVITTKKALTVLDKSDTIHTVTTSIRNSGSIAVDSSNNNYEKTIQFMIQPSFAEKMSTQFTHAKNNTEYAVFQDQVIRIVDGESYAALTIAQPGDIFQVYNTSDSAKTPITGSNLSNIVSNHTLVRTQAVITTTESSPIFDTYKSDPAQRTQQGYGATADVLVNSRGEISGFSITNGGHGYVLNPYRAGESNPDTTHMFPSNTNVEVEDNGIRVILTTNPNPTFIPETDWNVTVIQGDNNIALNGFTLDGTKYATGSSFPSNASHRWVYSDDLYTSIGGDSVSYTVSSADNGKKIMYVIEYDFQDGSRQNLFDPTPLRFLKQGLTCITKTLSENNSKSVPILNLATSATDKFVPSM